MKIGISYNPSVGGFLRYGKDAFQKIRSFGFTAIDYSLAETETPLYKLSDADLEAKMTEEREAVAEAGLEISQVHGPWRWPPQDATPEDRQERLEKMKRSLWATRLLGCKHWVVHPIMPCGIHDLETDEGQKTWDLNMEFMPELLAYAKEQDVIICLENMPMTAFSIATPADIMRVVQEMNDPHFQVCLDTGHVAVFSELTVGDSARMLSEHLKVMHVHDNLGNRDAHLWPTKGVIDWADFATALKEIGFNGTFSLETLPSAELNDSDFEAACIELYRIAEGIIFG